MNPALPNVGEVRKGRGGVKCDIIIPVWNQPEATRECIESIVRGTNYPYRLILVDNGSSPETRSYLEKLRDGQSPEVKLIRNVENLGYIKAVNQGLKASQEPYVCLMNNDTIPGVGWLEKLISFAETHKEIGLMNPLCNGHCSLSVDEYARKVAKNDGCYMEMNQCFGFCTLIKREVIEKIGHLDESFGIGGYDDTDYSRRASEAGYRCASVHSAYVYHKEHVSFKSAGVKDSFTIKGQKKYLKKWARHLRIGITFSLDSDVRDVHIERMLKMVLFLAREWCWINLWIFGNEEESRRRIDAASESIDMPSHQNIKFNFLSEKFAGLQTLIRLIERAFGTKKRKKYDVIFIDNERMASFLDLFYPLHTTKVLLVKPETWGDAQSWKKFLSQAAQGS